MQNLSLFESNSQPFTADNHLSFNFNNHHNPNLTMISSLTEIKSYTPITGCVLEHIITTTSLTNCEKLYYLLTDSLSLISKNRGESRSCALPSEDWAEYLGCSRSLVFTMQSSLVKKGYFIINKDWDKIGRNKRNLITPTLPTSVFNHLNEKYPDRLGDHASYNRFTECKRSYLDRTKLFIKLNYNLLKIITASVYLNPRGKIMWLSFYTRCYKNYMLQGREDFNLGKYSYNDDSSFSFISSYRELADLYSCNTKHLSKSIRALEELGFIKTQNIYIKRRCGNNGDYTIQERQDQSLWKIALSLPDDCILELEKIKDRSNLKSRDIKAEVAAIGDSVDSRSVENCLILGGIKFNLNLEQSDVLKSVIDGDNDNDLDCQSNIDTIPPLLHTTIPYAESYIDSIMEELDGNDTENAQGKLEESSRLENSNFLSGTSKTLSFMEALDNKREKSGGIKSDPHIAKSRLLLNKDLILKIKDLKSNLGAKPKVIFNDFLKKFRKDDSEICKGNNKKQKPALDFNICSELIRNKLKELPKDKADKARKFAYSIVSKKLATGYAATIGKHELAKQLIHHAATWKPTKLGGISREKEIDTALAVAWKSIVRGSWQPPLEFAKAEVLNYEYQYYRKKYQESGVLSHEIKSLESAVNNVLGGWCDLEGRITMNSKASCKNNELISIINTQKLIDNKNYQLESEAKRCSYQKNSSLLDDKGKTINITDYCIGDDYLETEDHSHYQKINLSHIPDQQKYLRVTPSDKKGDDIIKLETINSREYFVKLKELEMNDQGELVMTLKPNTNCIDLSKDTQDSSLSVKKKLKGLLSHLDLKSDANLQTRIVNNEIGKIDSIIESILKNIIINN